MSEPRTWAEMLDFSLREKLNHLAADPVTGRANQILANQRYVKGDLLWTAAPYAANWSDFASGTKPLAYKRVGDFLVIHGCAKPAAGAGTTIFTLPAPYRPPYFHTFATSKGGAIGFISVAATGVVSVDAVPGVGASVYLDGVRVPLL